MLQSNVQQTCVLQIPKAGKSRPLFYPSNAEFLQGECSLNGGLEHSRSNLVSEILDDSIFELPYNRVPILA